MGSIPIYPRMSIFPVVLAMLFVVLYSVQTGHQDHAVGGSQVWCVNAELVSPSSNLGQRYTMFLYSVLCCCVVFCCLFFISFLSIVEFSCFKFDSCSATGYSCAVNFILLNNGLQENGRVRKSRNEALSFVI